MISSQIDVGALLQRANDLLLILVKTRLRPVIEAELSDPKKKAFYNLTGTAMSVKKISEKIGIATGTISTTWQHWEDVGLSIKDGKSYRRVLG
jgi:biotin operon repressor